ncbi:hypothetical protein M5689_013181 [Euphorbia peplus]|nr:hypothetical protein M5689_013181 [Euphorbia peplus]
MNHLRHIRQKVSDERRASSRVSKRLRQVWILKRKQEGPEGCIDEHRRLGGHVKNARVPNEESAFKNIQQPRRMHELVAEDLGTGET